MKGKRFTECHLATALAISVCLIGSLTSASAYVLTLTGGDPGEGFSPEPILKYAYDTSGSDTATYTVQGVPFLPYHPGDSIPNISTTWPNTYDGLPAPSLGPTANDDALESILKTFWYADPNTPQTLTLGGLTSGQKYRVDLFIYKQDGPSGGTFTFNGDQTNSFTAATSVPYLVSEEVAANGSGQIV